MRVSCTQALLFPTVPRHGQESSVLIYCRQKRRGGLNVVCLIAHLVNRLRQNACASETALMTPSSESASLKTPLISTLYTNLLSCKFFLFFLNTQLTGVIGRFFVCLFVLFLFFVFSFWSSCNLVRVPHPFFCFVGET